MKIAVFSSKPYDRSFLSDAAAGRHELRFLDAHLGAETVILANGCTGICAFVNDCLDANVLQALSELGIRLIALRCAGFNNVDLPAARGLGIEVVRVPAYSPHAVAEHAVALILALNRKVHRAYNRVREGNFSLDGLLGFDMHGRTVGIIGTGRIGTVLLRILHGFGCKLLAYDIAPNSECSDLGARYVTMEELLGESEIISLHCPLSRDNYHLIGCEAISRMRAGVMLINTSRGGLLDTPAILEALKNRKIGALGLDVYEREQELFFDDHSDHVIDDDVFMRLLTFPNVLITGHQAFFTKEAMENIAVTTIGNITEWEESGSCRNSVSNHPVTGGSTGMREGRLPLRE